MTSQQCRKHEKESDRSNGGYSHPKHQSKIQM